MNNQGYRLINLVSKKFGTRLVLHRANKHSGSDKVFWSCVCDCGHISDVNSQNLRGLHPCKKCLKYSVKISSREAVLRTMFSEYRRVASNAKRSFSLSIEQFRALVESVCFYCGNEPKLRASHGNKKKLIRWHPVNGIDRVDNHLGYESSNCVPCCVRCNRAKLEMSGREFVLHCQKIVNYQCGKIPDVAN